MCDADMLSSLVERLEQIVDRLDSPGRGDARAVGPDQRYSYGFGYGFFLVRAGRGGGYMLGVEPAQPGGQITACKLNYNRELTITVNGVQTPGWVFQTANCQNNNNAYKYFFLASEPDGANYYIGYSSSASSVTQFQNNTYTLQAQVTVIDS